MNILLVLSRDDCTLPQLNVTILKGLLDALMAHLKTVLKALFPEKTAKIGQKRKLEKVKEETKEADDSAPIWDRGGSTNSMKAVDGPQPQPSGRREVVQTAAGEFATQSWRPKVQKDIKEEQKDWRPKMRSIPFKS